MKQQIKWTEGMKFEATAGDNSIMMDANAPIGKGSAMTPKELIGVGLAGCTAMDVVALLKKHKQGHESLSIDVDITKSTGGMPVVFTSAALTFNASGEIDKEILLHSIKMSQTKYCGVSAMLSKAMPITYVVYLNGECIGEGKADFQA